jgi:hypothetical protein
MPETPRTWTLGLFGTITVATLGPKLLPGDEPKVYEAGPVDAERERMLFLMERLVYEAGTDENGEPYPFSKKAIALLREHNRLQGGEDGSGVLSAVDPERDLAEEELSMMCGELSWPLGNRLALRLPGNPLPLSQLGFLVRSPKGSVKPIVHIGSIYAPTAEQHYYSDLRAIYDDGWRVH